MKVISRTEKSEIATVYIADFGSGKLVEFVESVQPPIPKDKKWVLIVSVLYGCPVGCPFCDAGLHYSGKLSKNEIFAQIDYLIKQYYPNNNIPIEKFKIQFARMGDPAFNPSLLDVLEEFPGRYSAPGFMPSVSSIAPLTCDNFFNRLREIKRTFYKEKFQLQFSIHSTDRVQRDYLIPVKKWDFAKIAEYGEWFFESGDRKITLNFALAKGNIINPDDLRKYFSPDIFLIKLTPLNPTGSASASKLESIDFDSKEFNTLYSGLVIAGYDTLISIGESEENKIGSNCGQYIMNYLKTGIKPDSAYSYQLEGID